LRIRTLVEDSKNFSITEHIKNIERWMKVQPPGVALTRVRSLLPAALPAALCLLTLMRCPVARPDGCCNIQGDNQRTQATIAEIYVELKTLREAIIPNGEGSGTAAGADGQAGGLPPVKLPPHMAT
jgi:hypothetical protein